MKNILEITKDTSLKYEVSEDTRIILVPSGKVSLELEIVKSGVSAEVLAVYSLWDKSKVELTTHSIHKVPHTNCTVVVKAALFDASFSSYEGRIYIGKDAQNTVSYLDDAVLSIGSGTKNSSKPILEILADDVKASHGATTGRLDEGMIYYLCSRGFTKEESEKLAISGFFETILGRIDDASMLEVVRKELHV